MHSAVRNVMRLFDRIKDFEKRVLAREREPRRGQQRGAARGALLLAQLLGPFAPHIAEELWIAFGNEELATQTPWPGVSLRGTPHEHSDRTEPPTGPGSGRARARPTWSAIAATSATRSSEPSSRARTAARAWTSSTTTSSPPATSRRSRASERPHNIWHFEELLPIVDARAQAASDSTRATRR